MKIQTKMADFVEHDVDLGVTHTWHNCTIAENRTTAKGVRVDIVQRPHWGYTCYMDGVIQSCVTDEEDYHRALVRHSVRSLRLPGAHVCVFGGGEGCTVRDIFRWGDVNRVDMFDWDAEVLEIFRRPEIARAWKTEGVWGDSRLHLEIADAFEVCHRSGQDRKYDLIVIDMFEPSAEDLNRWTNFLRSVSRWTRDRLVIYVGMCYRFQRTYSEVMFAIEKVLWDVGMSTRFRGQFVDSFGGDAVFIEAKHPKD